MLALTAARVAAENRGFNIVVLDTRGQTALFDYMVIATGTSRRQIHAMSEEIDHALEDDLDDKREGIEGYQDSRWVLLDYGSVMIHLFDSETREYYDLENLWGHAEKLELPAEIARSDVEFTPEPVDAAAFNPNDFFSDQDFTPNDELSEEWDDLDSESDIDFNIGH